MLEKDYILAIAKIGERKNVVKHDYYLTIDMAKELAMVENNLPKEYKKMELKEK